MNRQLIIGSIIGAAVATAIGGAAGYRLLDSENYAEVVSVTPRMVSVTVPVEECRDELVTHKKPVKDPNQITGTVAGAVIGGVLGHQVGGGTGKDIATVGGAVAGGYAGNKIQEGIQDRNVEQELQRVCTTTNTQQEQQDGYEVTYVRNGQRHTTVLDHDPGDEIALEEIESQPKKGG